MCDFKSHTSLQSSSNFNAKEQGHCFPQLQNTVIGILEEKIHPIKPGPHIMPQHQRVTWNFAMNGHLIVSDSSNSMDCSPPGSSVHGIFQAKVLEWGAIRRAIQINHHRLPYCNSLLISLHTLWPLSKFSLHCIFSKHGYNHVSLLMAFECPQHQAHILSKAYSFSMIQSLLISSV